MTVKIHDKAKPSAVAQLTAATEESHTVTDARGRVLVIRKPGWGATTSLMKAMPNGVSDDWKALANLAIWVVSIDEVLMGRPRTEREIDALVDIIDEAGFNEVQPILLKRLGPDAEEKFKDEVKNL